MAYGKIKIDTIETSTKTVQVDDLGAIPDGDKGDITVSGSGDTWTIDAGVVNTTKLGGDITTAGKALLDDADAAAQRTTLGLATVASTGAYSDLSGTPTVPSAADAAPQPLGVAAIGASTDYAREDHVHAMPSAADVGADPSGTAASAVSTHEAAADPHPGYALESSLGTAAALDVGTAAGNVVQLDGSGALPAVDGSNLTGIITGGTPGGTDGQIQFNDGGSFGGITGSSVGATGEINISLAGAASTPPVSFTGSWFTGGTATTTKPQLLIEPTGTTSTAWNTNGTGLGINAASGFTGNLLDLQLNGTSRVVATATGRLGIGVTAPGAPLDIVGGNAADLNNPALFIQNNRFLTFRDTTGFWGLSLYCNNSNNAYIFTPGNLSFTAGGTNVRLRLTNDGVIVYDQPAPTSKSAAATLTVAELKDGIVQYTGAADTLTLPTGTLMEGGFSDRFTNMTFEWSVINTGSGTCTIGAGVNHSIVGHATVAAGDSGRFASRRTAANTFVSYRLS